MYCREDGTPYYIGKGKGNRINNPDHNLNLPPVERRKYLKTNLTEEESFRHEMYMIHVLGRKDTGTGILRNLTNGGEGTSGFIPSTETKNIWSEQRKGSNNPNWKGGIYSDPNEYMRQRRKSKPKPPTGPSKRKGGVKGRKFSEETKEKMRKNNTGSSNPNWKGGIYSDPKEYQRQYRLRRKKNL